MTNLNWTLFFITPFKKYINAFKKKVKKKKSSNSSQTFSLSFRYSEAVFSSS